MSDTPHRITLCRIREWGACAEGRDWFRAKFPNGGSYAEVLDALLADARRADANWLTNKALTAWDSDGALIAQAVADEIAMAGRRGEVASGNGSTLAASGKGSTLAASGHGSTLVASGNGSTLAASGDYSTLAASGDDSRLAASGDDSRLAASGNDSIVTIGANGCAAVVYHDGTRYRFAAAITGDGELRPGEQRIEPGRAYRVNSDGVFVLAGA